MARERPINADVPAPDPPEAPPQPPDEAPPPSQATPKPADVKPPPPPKPPPRVKRRRQPIPTTLKLVAALVVVAVVFIVAAILGGSGSGDGGSIPGAPAPAGEAPAATEAPVAEAAAKLGYPAFATKNTTRVGGGDPASNAAGVALATFPSAAPRQRPAAVTLVDADEWQSAIAAAVLMAEPVRAPVLISGPDGLPEPTSEALDALDPQGSDATGGAQAFAVGAAAVPEGSKTTRAEAAGPAATAAAIAELRDTLFGAPPEHVVIAPAGRPGIAMPAAAWAARSGDPVLFTGRDKLPPATAAALRRHPDTPAYVLGPPAAISLSVVRQIAKIAASVRRVSGEDPVANAIALARHADGGFGWDINDPGHGFVVARDDSPLDAAAAAALSASGTWGPLLLTDSAGTLAAALRGYLLDVKPGYTTDPTRAFYNHVWVIGDQEAIDVSQQAEIDSLAELTKIGGGR